MDQKDGGIGIALAALACVRHAGVGGGTADPTAAPVIARHLLAAALILGGCSGPATVAAIRPSPSAATGIAPAPTKTPVPTIEPIPDGYRVQVFRLGIDLPV